MKLGRSRCGVSARRVGQALEGQRGRLAGLRGRARRLAARQGFPSRGVRCSRGDDRAEGLTPHEMRHTAASLAISAGANVKAVQRMLGHA